jgi:hypothetical protein
VFYIHAAAVNSLHPRNWGDWRYRLYWTIHGRSDDPPVTEWLHERRGLPRLRYSVPIAKRLNQNRGLANRGCAVTVAERLNDDWLLGEGWNGTQAEKKG